MNPFYMKKATANDGRSTDYGPTYTGGTMIRATAGLARRRHRGLLVGMLGVFAAASPVHAQADATPLTIEASSGSVCAKGNLTLSAKQEGAAVQVKWSVEPGAAGTLSDSTALAKSVVFHAAPDQGSAALYGSATVTATAADRNTTASKLIRLDGFCRGPYGGDLVRGTVGFEQIGASGTESAQKYSFDLFITRPIPWGPSDDNFGPYLRWWGAVGVASYPQQLTSDVASFATGFATSAGQVKVSQLVQSAEFTTGVEFRLGGSSQPVRGIGESTWERFGLMAFGGIGAVGPFPLATDAPSVFVVPDSNTAQRRAFAADYPGVTTKYVAFRVKAPDRFLENVSGGLRLYTFYTDPAGAPLQTAPAMVSIGYGRNDLIAPNHGGAWHVAAYYPFALGDRSDPATLIVYLFGDAWMTGGGANLSAPAYQLSAATADGAIGATPVAASDPDVTIVPVDTKPRDTYRIGVSVDLLKIWRRLAAGGAAK